MCDRWTIMPKWTFLATLDQGPVAAPNQPVKEEQRQSHAAEEEDLFCAFNIIRVAFLERFICYVFIASLVNNPTYILVRKVILQRTTL